MKKLYALIMILSLLFVITGCKKNNGIKRPIDIDHSITYFGSAKGVSDITITNVPKEIKIGYFASANIKLVITYLDGIKEEQHITEKFLPKAYLEDLKTEGDKYFDFIYKEKHIPLKFKQVAADVPMYYSVDFVDETGKNIEHKYVKYLDEAFISQSKVNLVRDYIKDGYYYKFTKTFDQDLDYIYSNMTCKPVFVKYKTYGNSYGYYDKYSYPPIYEIIDAKIDSDLIRHTLLYVDRVTDFAASSLTKPYLKEDYSDKVWRFRKTDSMTDFYQEVNDNLKNLVKNNYYHETESEYPYQPGITCTSTCYLNFNLNDTNSYEMGNDTTGKFNINLQDCFTGDLTKTMYNPDRSLKRRDGGLFNYDSIFELDPNLYLSEDYYDGTSSVQIQDILGDIIMGYYNLDFVIDVDVYIDVIYEFVHNGNDCMFILQEVNLVFCYVPGSAKYVLNHSTDNTYEYHGTQFKISDGMLADTLYEVETR